MSSAFTDTILIYSDGACTGNPGPGGWGAIVFTPDMRVTELGGGDKATTNNRMEMLAAIRALEFVADLNYPVLLFTDSTYVIRGITQWIHGWRRRGWQSANGSPVANQDLWRLLLEVTTKRDRLAKVDWRYVRGHTGVEGNERCDEIAVAISQGKRPTLYKGPLLQYDVPILDLPPDQELPENHSSQKEKKKPLSYLSYVGGVLSRHPTWSECERAVKGRPGAKFKKAHSTEEEQAIVREWGLDPKRLKG